MTTHKPKIAVIGSGYVGTTTAAIFATSGFDVCAIDINPQKIELINSGQAPFFEQGLDSLIKHGVSTQKLSATDNYRVLENVAVIFSCVGTPDNPDGSSNLSYVFAAAESALRYMPANSIFVQKSTVPVGTGAQIEALFAAKGKKASYVSNPEFLREGTAIADTLWFDRIVAGGENVQAVQKVLDLYKVVEKHRDDIAKIAKITGPKKHSGSYIVANRNSAELIKVTSNAFLALKISFANSIAKLADQTNADISEVMDAVGADNRIGRAFLNAGRGYGGGCFPKDVSGLISSATEHGVDLGIMTAASELNDSMPGYIANKAQEVLGELKGKRVAVLGLAFKAGTSDARRSQGVKLANILSHDGAKVTVFDPEANGEAKEDLRKAIQICESLQDAVRGVDAVFIATEWPEFLKLNLKSLKSNLKGNLFVDCMNRFDKQLVQAAGFRYIGVGRS